MNFSNHPSLSGLLPPEHHQLHVFGDENQADTHLNDGILNQFPPNLLPPTLSDPLSPTFMASADNNAQYPPSPGAEYHHAEVDLSHIQSLSTPPQPHALAQDQQTNEHADHLASKGPATEESFKVQHDGLPNEHQEDQHHNTSTSSSGNENEQATAQISVQPSIQKSQKKLKRGPYMCKLCRRYGHTAKTCTKRRNPVVHRALNGLARRDQYFSTLIAIDEVSRKSPKEQLYLHHEAIITAIYHLSLSAYRRNPYRRENAIQAVSKCMETERVIAECIGRYKQASSRLGAVISGKENMANYSGPITQHPEFKIVVEETRRCIFRTIAAMRNADCSIRNILSSSLPSGVNKRPEPLVGMDSTNFSMQQDVRQAPSVEAAAAVHQSQEQVGCTNAQRKPAAFMFPMTEKADVLNFEDEGISSAPIDFRGTAQQLDASFREIDLFMPEEKE